MYEAAELIVMRVGITWLMVISMQLNLMAVSSSFFLHLKSSVGGSLTLWTAYILMYWRKWPFIQGFL